MFKAIWLFVTLLAVCASSAQASQDKPLQFGVINQRSVALTAQSWNPILAYIGKKTGAPLALKMGKTAPETTAMTERGEHAFVYSNHLFTRERDKLGYKVILRMVGAPILGVIVVREDSPIRSLKDLKGASVAFPSREAFVGYWLPMDQLIKDGIDIKETFAGNQEGAISQLQFGKVAAAAVNNKLLDKYVQREDFRYRVIWTSEPYLDIPVMVHPAVPAKLAEAVRDAFIGMAKDPDGQKALQASADALESKQTWSFVRAEDKDYDNYRRFFRNTLVKDD
jgi:phosphonate transport system substrate-binding protein